MTTIYFDFETGGVLPEHPNIQLAAIAVDDATGGELAAFEQKIQFDPKQCATEALALNGWQEEAWKDALPVPAVAAKFDSFLAPHKCVRMVSKRTGSPYNVAKGAGYNALTFDWPRLKALFGTRFLPMSYRVRDVLQRAVFYFDEHPDLRCPDDYKLSTICEYFGIKTEGAHDALVDVRLTAALYWKLKESPLTTSAAVP